VHRVSILQARREYVPVGSSETSLFPKACKTVTRHTLGLLPLLCFLLAACAGPGYYVQAAGGHWKLMRARQDVAEIIARSDGALAARLRTAQDILRFAESGLGLPAGGSYRSYVETGRKAVTWSVVAAPEFSLEAKKWCFPVAGCVPYRGYFSRDKAERFAGRLRARGLDVAVTPVTAYSTLGWFDDPLLDTMLPGPDALLAATIIHELAHRRLYVKGDTAFSESYARFVEHRGVLAWLDGHADEAAQAEYSDRHRAVRDFQRLLASTRSRLAALYTSGLEAQDMRGGKRAAFAELQEEYARLKTGGWGGRDWFGAWFDAGVNNARLALFSDYEDGLCAFQGLFALSGGDFEAFHRLAAERAKLAAGERREWLEESC